MLDLHMFVRVNSQALEQLYGYPSISKVTLKETDRIDVNLIITHRQASDISRTLAGNKIVDHSDVVGAAPVGATPTTSST